MITQRSRVQTTTNSEQQMTNKKRTSKSKKNEVGSVGQVTPGRAVSGKTRVKVPPARLVSSSPSRRTPAKRERARQFGYMRAPGVEHAFQVGGPVEVYCDHEKSGERIRGWIRGIVVQVDNKMVAVQFRTNVFLTDGWMVPDRILWYPIHSEHIRSVEGKKIITRVIPDY